MPDCFNGTHALPVQQVHLWFAPVPGVEDAKLFARYMALMSPHERERHARFVFQRDKRRHAVTRALVRSVLSRYAGIAPERWVFVEGAYGRPEIASEDQQALDLRFNISHTSELVVLAVARHREVGVDIESTTRQAPLDVADHYFSVSEAKSLCSMPPDTQHRRFLELWTFKESYIKARGMGLSLPLNKLSFHMVHPGAVVFNCDESIDASPNRWMFCQLKVDNEHLVALCVERTAAESIDIVCHCIEPLGAERRWSGQLTRCSAEAGACSVEPANTLDSAS